MDNSFSDGPMSGHTKMFCNFCNQERIHIDARPIIWCCLKEFIRQHNSKKHEKTNSGKNKFGSSNKTKDKKFERDHEKPFSCSFCDYKCNQSSKIVTHGQTRQGTMWGGCGPWEVTSEHSPPYEKLHLAVYETAFGSVWDCLRQCMRLPSAVYESIDWAYRNSCNSFDINPLADLQRTFFRMKRNFEKKQKNIAW